MYVARASKNKKGNISEWKRSKKKMYVDWRCTFFEAEESCKNVVKKESLERNFMHVSTDSHWNK